MMYKNDFVAVVKAEGKILREDKDTVYVPFSSEFSILMKNLYGRKAAVKVSIDGTDVLNGHRLIIDANDELELERYLDSIDKGNKFKFIQKTQKIQEHRGDKIDDGIIRIEFQFEKPQKSVELYTPIFYKSSADYNSNGWANTTSISSSTINSNNYTSKSCGMDNLSSSTQTYSGSNSTLRSKGLSNSLSRGISEPLSDEGITVKGSVSDQKFKYGSLGELESEKHVITLQLKGCSPSGRDIEKPLTVKTAKECSTCGRKNKSTSKYCVECGTYLD